MPLGTGEQAQHVCNLLRIRQLLKWGLPSQPGQPFPGGSQTSAPGDLVKCRFQVPVILIWGVGRGGALGPPSAGEKLVTLPWGFQELVLQGEGGAGGLLGPLPL